MKIKNNTDLRDHLLASIEDLDKGKIDIEHLAAVSKAAEAVVSSAKIELAYNAMKNQEPVIKFLENSDKKSIK